MRRLPISIASAALGFALTAHLAAAGVVMEFETTGGKDAKPQPGSVFVESDRLRTETAGTIAIFRGDKQALWIVQPNDKSYMEITKASLEAMSAQLAGVQEQMKNLPPEIQAKMAAMMGKQAGGAAALPARTYKKGAGSEEVNGFPCTRWESSRGGEKDQDLWVTDWKRFDLKAADFAVFGQMADFVSALTGPIAKQMAGGFTMKFSESESPDAIPGVPIRTITHNEMGKWTHEIKKVAQEAIPAAKFEIPEGFKKKDMMGGAPGK